MPRHPHKPLLGLIKPVNTMLLWTDGESQVKPSTFHRALSVLLPVATDPAPLPGTQTMLANKHADGLPWPDS